MASALAPSRAPVVRGGTTRRRVPAARILVPRASAEPVTSLAAELASLVARGSRARDDARVIAIVDELERARPPVNPCALTGAYEVAWSDGTMAWRALVARGVSAIAGRSRAGQWFTPGTPGRALNFAELFDKSVVITAEGTFRPKPADADAAAPHEVARDARYPIGFDVRIERGDVRAFGRRWALPIRGPGEFQMLYGDADVRVFRSSGGVAVQVPSDWQRPAEDEE